MKKKTAFMEWIDGQLKADPRLAHEVDELVNKMRLDQELAALREKRGLSQRQLAKLLGASQPYVAKLESGRIKNLGVNTLVKYARALGGSVTIKIEPSKRMGGGAPQDCGGRDRGPSRSPRGHNRDGILSSSSPRGMRGLLGNLKGAPPLKPAPPPAS